MKRVLEARGDVVPYDAMAELMEMARRDESARRELLAELETQLWNAERDMALAWLCVVAGEAGRPGLRALIDLLGKTPSEDVSESAIPALTRHVLEVYGDIKRAIDASPVVAQRCALYEALLGAVVLGDADVKRDLAEFARTRVRRELERPAGKREVLGPLGLLVYLGAADASEWLRQVRGRVRAKASKANLLELEAELQRGADPPLEPTRATLAETWRETAANLRKLFHPTEGEKRQLQALLASLHPSGRGTH